MSKLSTSLPMALVVLIHLLLSGGCHDSDVRSAEVDIKPSAESAWMEDNEVLVRLEPGERVATWSTKSLACFSDLEAGRTYQVHLPERFLYERRTLRASNDGVVRSVVGALAFSSLTSFRFDPDRVEPGKVLYIDTTADPNHWVLDWRDGYVLAARHRVPRDLQALAPVLRTQHKEYGSHGSCHDPKSDSAVVVVPHASPFEEVAPLVKVFDRVRRLHCYHTHEERPVFSVRLARPDVANPPEPSPAPPPIKYVGPTPVVRAQVTESDGIDTETAQSALAKAESRIRLCYQHALVTAPQLKDRLHLEVWIGVDGRVARTTLRKRRDVVDGRVARCVIEAIQAQDFSISKQSIKRLIIQVELTLGQR